MNLKELAKMIEDLRTTALFGGTDPLNGKYIDAVPADGLDVISEQEFLSCLAYLELAQRAANKAEFIQVRLR